MLVPQRGKSRKDAKRMKIPNFPYRFLLNLTTETNAPQNLHCRVRKLDFGVRLQALEGAGSHRGLQQQFGCVGVRLVPNYRTRLKEKNGSVCGDTGFGKEIPLDGGKGDCVLRTAAINLENTNILSQKALGISKHGN